MQDDAVAVDLGAVVLSEKKLSRRQSRALKALLKNDSVKAAAAEADVAVRSINRWIRTDESFQRALREARTAMLEGCLVALSTSTTRAVQVLNECMETGTPATKERAARTVLRSAQELRENLEMGKRLEEMEGALADQELH